MPRYSQLALLVTSLTLPIISCFANNFSGGEHTLIGNAVKLHPCLNCDAVPGMLLTMANGLKLSYGQINALAGDFYGIQDKPISSGSNKPQQFAYFARAFQELYKGEMAVTEVPQILAVMQTEFDAIDRAKRDGVEPSVEIEKLGNSLSRQWNVITGGGSAASDWVPFGRYMALAQNNVDHFVPNSWNAYAIGHEYALRTAVEGYKKQDNNLLLLAYAQNAFADHYLEDQFPAGHLRVPRTELPANVTPSILGDYLTNYMHAEDNKYGLKVSNARGDSWTTYGDGHYLNSDNATTYNIVNEAIQLGADEIYQAFVTGTYPAPENFAVRNLIPTPDPVASAGTSPMFLSGSKRRSDLNRLQDYTWTENWSALGTLLILETIYGPLDGPSVEELMLNIGEKN